MKVFYPIVRTYSGADVHFEELSRVIGGFGHEAVVRYYPHWMDFAPTLVQRHYASLPAADLVHTKVEYGPAFAQRGQPLLVKLAHLVFDPVSTPYRSLAQRAYHWLKLRPSIAWSLRRAECRVAISRSVRDAFCRYFSPQDIRVIYNGVDETKFRPLTPPPPREDRRTRLLFVGNLSRRKGADLLPQILARLGDNFVLAYTSGLRSDSRLRGPANLSPLGRPREAELIEEYNRADIFLFPSRLEGFGLPVVEAMACGKPVVCTRTASLPELVDDGQGGFLCELDAVDEFVRRIRVLAEDAGLRQAMGAYNRAKVERCFTLRGSAEQYAAAYAEIASG